MQSHVGIKKDIVWAFLLVIQFVVYFFYLKTGSYVFLASYFLSGLSLLFVFLSEKINIKFLVSFFVIIVFFIVASLFSQEFPFYVNLYNIFYGMVALVSAYALFVNNYSVIIVKSLFLLYSFFIFYFIFKFGFNDPNLYNNLLEGSSRNYLSAIFVLLLILLILTYERNKENISLIYPLVTFVGCFSLFGRSGIIFSFLILVYLSFRVFGLKVFSFIIILFSLFAIYRFNDLQNLFFEKTNFVNGVDSERSIFLVEYLHGIEYKPYDLFFGRRLQQCCNWILLFNSNPHNSFIMGHIRYGVVHTLFSFLIFLYIVFSKNLTYVFLGLVILSRFFVDQIGLFTPFDIVLYFLLFLIYASHKEKIIKFRV